MHLCNVPSLVIPPPIGLKADDVSSRSLMVSWQAPDDLKGFIIEYQVSYIMHNGSEQLHEVQDTTSTELTSLEPHTEYTIRVRAKVVDFGDYSTPITIRTTGNVEIGLYIVHNLLHNFRILHAVSCKWSYNSHVYE